jgi:hypothetical protein
MATEKDRQFVQFMNDQTLNGRIHWETTADMTKFVVSLRGKYKVTVDRGTDDSGDENYWLTLFDDSERELLMITDYQVKTVREIFYLAQRSALDVDSVIDDIMSAEDSSEAQPSPGPITDDDLPF